MVRQTALLVIVLGALAVPQAVRAGVREEARKHYDRAVELVDDGQLEGAIVEFERSYDLTHHFAVLYNIGQVFVSLARPVEAVDAYERYLADGGRKVPADRRAEVEKEIVRQKARIATLEIRGLPRKAIVRLDGNEIGRAPISAPVRVGVGKHTIAASAEGYDSAEKDVTVAGEDHKTVELVLAKRVVESPPPPPPAAQSAPVQPVTVTVVAPAQPPPWPRAAVEPSTKPMSNVRLLGILTGVAGVAGIAAGGACWWVGMSRNDESKDNWSTNPDKANSLRGEAQDYLNAGNTLFAVGGGLVVLGVVLYLVGAPDGPATPNTHAYLMPALGPRFAGLNAGGTW